MITILAFFLKPNVFVREPLWLGGKMKEWENKRNQMITGSLPSPARVTF
jgi:hypothetical protein